MRDLFSMPCWDGCAPPVSKTCSVKRTLDDGRVFSYKLSTNVGQASAAELVDAIQSEAGNIKVSVKIGKKNHIVVSTTTDDAGRITVVHEECKDAQEFVPANWAERTRLVHGLTGMVPSETDAQRAEREALEKAREEEALRKQTKKNGKS